MSLIAIEYIEMRNGAARVAGKGVKVENIAILATMHGWPVEKIAEELELTPAQIHAALSYYYDHKAEIDQAIKEGDELARQVGTSFDDLRRQIEDRQRGKTE